MTSHGVRIDLYYSPAMQSSCAPLALPVIHLAHSEDLDCIETTACVALQLGPSSSLMLTQFLVRKKALPTTMIQKCSYAQHVKFVPLLNDVATRPIFQAPLNISIY